MIYLLNSSIIPNEGDYRLVKSDLQEAIEFLIEDKYEFVSAIGHKVTADILSTMLRAKVDVNRIEVKMEPWDVAIIFKLRRRIEEGRILDVAEIDEIGYDFYLMIRLK
jgi:hypothetical protein